MWCNWNPLKRCWYSEQIQQQLNIPSSSYFHRTLHFIQPNNLFSFSVSFWMGNLSRKIESNLNGNRQFMASTIYSWQKPSREWKKTVYNVNKTHDTICLMPALVWFPCHWSVIQRNHPFGKHTALPLFENRNRFVEIERFFLKNICNNSPVSTWLTLPLKMMRTTETERERAKKRR